MGPCRNYLILHAEEWKRLKNQGSPTQSNKAPPENKYIKSLIEKSQNWIKTWPDTVQGHVCQVEEQKKKQHSKDVALIRLLKTNHKTDHSTENIEKAKKMIFDESCYGRRLLSALIESKTLEERDVQIEFQKELAENAKTREQKEDAISSSLQNATDMEKHEKELAKRKRDKDKEVAQINKSIFLAKNQMKARNEEKRKQMELEDLRLIKELIKKETCDEPQKKIQFRKYLEDITAVRKEIEQNKAEREYEDERRAEIWRNYIDRKKIKMEMIHKKRFDTPQFTKHYELVNKLEEEKKLRYDEFVNSGVNMLTRQLQDESQKEIKRKVNHSLIQSNKKLAESKQINKCENKCTCDRQSIITKGSPHERKTPIRKDVPKFTPTNYTALVKNVKVKEKETTPWTGTCAAHAQFAQEANATLQQCRYKNMARKVVDDYRRLNCLDPETLPIPDYF